jgi:hypothetical protein
MGCDGFVGIISFPVTRFHRGERMAKVGLVLFVRTALEVMQEVLTIYYCKFYKHTCIRITGCAPESTRIYFNRQNYLSMSYCLICSSSSYAMKLTAF